MKKINILIIAFLFIPFYSFARIPNGYRGMKWGTSRKKVFRKFGNMKVGNSAIYGLKSYASYVQSFPTKIIRARTFYFFKNRLCGVKIVYNYGAEQYDRLMKISRALRRDFGNRKVKKYNSKRHGKVVHRIDWRGNGTKVIFLIAQQGTDVVVTNQKNFLYFSSIRYNKAISKAAKRYRQKQNAKSREANRQERGY